SHQPVAPQDAHPAEGRENTLSDREHHQRHKSNGQCVAACSPTQIRLTQRCNTLTCVKLLFVTAPLDHENGADPSPSAPSSAARSVGSILVAISVDARRSRH